MREKSMDYPKIEPNTFGVAVGYLNHCTIKATKCLTDEKLSLDIPKNCILMRPDLLTDFLPSSFGPTFQIKFIDVRQKFENLFAV
jgi:hypothetical protein